MNELQKLYEEQFTSEDRQLLAILKGKPIELW